MKLEDESPYQTVYISVIQLPSNPANEVHLANFSSFFQHCLPAN
jgi:hypothetical protein